MRPLKIAYLCEFQADRITAPYWAGNSSYGPVFMIINTQNTTQTYDFWLTENCMYLSTTSPCLGLYRHKYVDQYLGAVRAGREYLVRDLWTHQYVGVATR